MQIEIIDGKPCMVGRGENLVYEILKETFPKARIERQKKLTDLCAIHDPSERQRKETIDIVMWWNHQKIAIRVQNKKGEKKMQSETTQKWELKNSEFLIADISEHECENVFKELKNYIAYLEIFSSLFRAGLKP
jgi:hypothetical protein